MASNLPSATELGQLNACLIRAARLDTDCSPLGGADSGYVTIGLAQATATPDVEEGTVIEPKNACGVVFYTYANDDVIKRWNLAGELLVFDWEGMELLFNGRTILGAAGGDFAGNVIGFAYPDSTAAARNGVYLEIITQVIGRGTGDCLTAAGDAPQYIGHIFPKVKLTPGERTFEEDAARLTFTGKATSNPALFNGPWNDYPGAGYIPSDTGYLMVGYSADEYDAIFATAGAGYQTLPAGS